MRKDGKEKPRESRAPLTEDNLRGLTIGELRPLQSPVRVVEYDPEWPLRFESFASEIRSALGNRALRVEHVGSTSVPGLPSKPSIDISLVVVDSANEANYVPLLESRGYMLHIREPEWYEHRMLKGPEDAVNLHVFSHGCEEIDRMVCFRDWLRTNRGDLELYARTKLTLAQREWKYTQNYADAKTEVIEEILAKMKAARTTA